MKPDDDVCLCFHVTLRKICTFLDRENPAAASQISDCLGAGTGCHWCVPNLESLHAQHRLGQSPDLHVSPADYAKGRADYRRTGSRSGSQQGPPPPSDPQGRKDPVKRPKNRA